MTPPEAAPLERIRVQCRALGLPTLAAVAAELVATAQRENWSLEAFAAELLGHELEGRRQHRIARLTQEARLPPGKTLATLDQRRLPLRIRRLLPELCRGDFADRADNLLLFGLPGRGKTHVAAAVAHELVQQGRRVLFTPTYALIARLLRAKRDLELERELRRLDRFAVVVLDDSGYVQQSREEMEVLFTFLAERYERRSVVITSNLLFSEWDRIFQNPLTTAAAIDRVVHHSVILEFGAEMPSLRAEAAAQRRQADAVESPPAADPTPDQEVPQDNNQRSTTREVRFPVRQQGHV
ncbi:MAG TPA: IS21-like element helper ATPase IstB [Chloroflexota bacterium]|jgi:DNA replication protein DnaC|nr:IS21-like element helper ATPase IstB [Chloroflexota bacterium]